jgi:arsenite-transporting ATPase
VTEIVLFGGKGGVGKTTMAAASALRSAGAGHETLVVSTDPAHSLADTFETDLDGDPTEVRPHLWAVELDPQTGVDRYEALFSELAATLGEAGIRLDDEDVAALFSAGVTPGSDELAALEALATYLDDDRWDLVVFDTAPTGHTLRLLDLPEVLDRGMATAIDLRERLERVGAALRDPDRTTFRVVTVPETMALRETERLVARLREFDIPVSTVVVNKVIEDAGDCERCRANQAVQTETLDELRGALPELAVWTVPDEPGEVVGLDALERVATHLEPTVE